MKLKVMMLVAAAGALLSAGAVSAQDTAALMKSKGCFSCHDVEAKKMGPSYKELSAKYANDKDAVARIAKEQKEGKGHMKIAATDDELKAMVTSALSHK
ncbi:MAG: c-type cytochrome [Proteobacteria bacterium]|nr:c-type cytochrome [Pseudomonadota bacterium]